MGMLELVGIPQQNRAESSSTRGVEISWEVDYSTLNNMLRNVEKEDTMIYHE